MDKHYMDEEMMVMHESAQTLFGMSLINAAEMRKFDQDCLVQEGETAPVAGNFRSKPITPAFTSPWH